MDDGKYGNIYYAMPQSNTISINERNGELLLRETLNGSLFELKFSITIRNLNIPKHLTIPFKMYVYIIN